MSPPVAASQPLSEEQIERYARQIIVPGIGAEGQKTLCAAEIFVDGHAAGRTVAAQYLRAAGMRVPEATNPAPRIDCIVLAGVTDMPCERVKALSASAPLVAWYAVVGGRVHGGLADAAHPIRVPEFEAGGQLAVHADVVHHIAGADVATTTVAALLRWIAPGDCYVFAIA
jgi:hypothetical protein